MNESHISLGQVLKFSTAAILFWNIVRKKLIIITHICGVEVFDTSYDTAIICYLKYVFVSE